MNIATEKRPCVFGSGGGVSPVGAAKSLGREVGYARKCQVVSTPEIPASGRSQRKSCYVTAHVLQEDFNEATIAADATACRRRPVWRELLLGWLAESFSGKSAADNSRRLQSSGCQTLPIRSGTGRLGDHRCFGILAVQGRYKRDSGLLSSFSVCLVSHYRGQKIRPPHATGPRSPLCSASSHGLNPES